MLNKNWEKRLKILLLLTIFWELFIFIRLPKQAFIQGLMESWFVSKGLVFYKDFGGQYLPFLRLLMVPLHSIFGYTQNVTILLAPINSIAIMLALFFASKKWLKGKFSTIPLIFFTIWHTFLSNNHFVASSFLSIIILISVILWLSWWEKPTRGKSLLLGISTAAGILTLQIVLPFYFLLNLSFLLRFRNSRILAIKHLLLSMSGFLIPTLIIIFWFLSKGALSDLYVWTIKYHFTNYPYSSLGRGMQDILIYLSVHLPILLFLVTGFRNIQKSYMFLMLFSLPLVFWYAIFHPLRFEISLPAFSLALGLVVQDLSLNKKLKFRKLGIALLFLIFVINFYTITKYKLATYNEKLFITKYKYSVISAIYPDDPMYDAVSWMKKNSLQTDKIFVLGDALFYVETNRLMANRRAVAAEPFVYVPFNEFEKEIENSWPSYWVIDERQWKRMEDFGYKEVATKFQKLVEKDPIVARFQYWIIRKH